jgi:nitrate/nitrite transporter NarK
MPERQKSPVKAGADSSVLVAEVNEATALLPESLSQYQVNLTPSPQISLSTQTNNPQSFDNAPNSESQQSDDDPQDPSEKPKSLMGMISVLLIGVFVSQADTSLVLATYGKISSEFNDLESGSWLLSAAMLAMCVTQPLYGKLSDIYGRKRCLQAAYVLFAAGTAGCGLGRSMGQLIAARAVQGAGGAGMVCMVSILLTDLVPLHEVAVYRSYVNIVQTIGRSCGGAVGGFLAGSIGWR